ncbi:MauE/DoxX family redox-associated membrane protein [Paenibacillus ehimensis]|uniref:MauE/DoxX family redox-associated membrane protein n=1 Tax=Paenibacillus ehimensis TaxID=79264 RepID=UPI003D2A86E0
MRGLIAYVLDVTIAVLFFLPFYMKLRSYGGLRVDIYSYGVLPVFMLSLAACAVLITEFLLFFLFATGLAEGWKQIAGIGLLSAFTWLTWRKKKSTGAEACVCYGDVGFLNRFPIYRNLVLIGILLIDAGVKREPGDVYSMLHSLVLVMSLSFTVELVTFRWKRREV